MNYLCVCLIFWSKNCMPYIVLTISTVQPHGWWNQIAPSKKITMHSFPKVWKQSYNSTGNALVIVLY
jgi:hypothetical protein